MPACKRPAKVSMKQSRTFIADFLEKRVARIYCFILLDTRNRLDFDIAFSSCFDQRLDSNRRMVKQHRLPTSTIQTPQEIHHNLFSASELHTVDEICYL